MRARIEADWIILTSSQYDKKEGYVNIQRCVQKKMLTMEIIERPGFLEGDPPRQVLNFLHGPTGYESFHLDDYLVKEILTSEEEFMCLCAGTVNSWPQCNVKRSDVKSFLERCGYGKK